MKSSFVLTALCLLGLSANIAMAEESKNPNFVVILCDDLGIGDVQCFNPKLGKIKTPNIDRIAKQGMSFTDAHSGSSVCTPTRYGMLTGRYSWRTTLQKGVASGFGPSLIAADRLTVGNFLQSKGYHTAVIGKWHLNMMFTDPGNDKKELDGKPLKFTAPVGSKSPDGPITRGFDYFYGIHHARSMKAIIEQDVVTEHDDPINFLPATETRAVKYIEEQAKSEKPFFLYLPLSSPHTPIVPTKKWQGASGLGAYADFVMQTDHVVGQVMNCLEKQGLEKNTVVLFASDNGCSRQAKIGQLAKKGHHVSGGLRGSKSDIWEGGHRIPLIVRWPGNIKPQSKSDQLICLTDLFATFVDILGDDAAPESTCEDSVSFLPALQGKPMPVTREGIVHHSISGHFAYRSKDWKLILARGSGGWSAPNEKKVSESAPEAQLYQLGKDIKEQDNLYETRTEIASDLLKKLEQDVRSGRSTPGKSSKNDIENVEIWKSKRKLKLQRN